MTSDEQQLRVGQQRTTASIDREIGELTGRMTAVEREQEQIRVSLDRQYKALCRISDEMHLLSKRIAWLMGGIAVVVSIAGASGWYMAQAGIPPLDGAAGAGMVDHNGAENRS